MGTCALRRQAWLQCAKSGQSPIPISLNILSTQTINHKGPMTAFPKDLKEIKDRIKKERREKPGKDDKLTPKLSPFFIQANEKPVKHAHHEDLEENSQTPAMLAFVALPDPDREKLENGLLALDQIFQWIMGETSKLLDKINQAIADFNEADPNTDPTQPTSEAAAVKKYYAATDAFNAFVYKLNDPTPTPDGSGYFGATINAANIEPIQTGGYYTSASVVIQWRGGTHSGSSQIHVP